MAASKMNLFSLRRVGASVGLMSQKSANAGADVARGALRADLMNRKPSCHAGTLSNAPLQQQQRDTRTRMALPILARRVIWAAGSPCTTMGSGGAGAMTGWTGGGGGGAAGSGSGAGAGLAALTDLVVNCSRSGTPPTTSLGGACDDRRPMRADDFRFG